MSTLRSKTYEAYGAQRSGYTGDEAKSYGYVGQLGHRTDSECGLIYMRARYYDPMLGRFISEDPGVDGLNRYAYCRSNPVSYLDEGGRKALSAAEAITLMSIGTALVVKSVLVMALDPTCGLLSAAVIPALMVGAALMFMGAALGQNGSAAFVAGISGWLTGGIAGTMISEYVAVVKGLSMLGKTVVSLAVSEMAAYFGAVTAYTWAALTA